MLHELSIGNLGVIDSARVTLGPGLTVVTGETGAGKTMILTGLGLILGAKADAGAVRVGADEALAEAILAIAPGSEAATIVDDAGAVVEDGEVVIARTVGATTRSRATLGGRTVPHALLADLAQHVVTVHGQSDQVRLRTAARQRETLDAYAGTDHLALLTDYRDAWAAWADARSALAAMEEGAQAQRAEVARLRADLAAIDAVDPQPGEDDALAGRISVLENLNDMRLAVAGAHDMLAGDDGATAVAVLEAAGRVLGPAAAHEPSMRDLETRIADLRYHAADIATELSRYLDGLDADGSSLDALHARRSSISTLLRRFGTDLDGLLALAGRARTAIATDDAWDDTLEARRADERAAARSVDELAAAVHRGRERAAADLAAAVEAELAQLAMIDARFGVDVVRVTPGPHGANTVSMTLAAHPGAQPRPVADAASGGELSRIMLAIEVSLARRAVDAGHTFVFDEVDAGVGGKAAAAVGQRLALLARTHQVIVVTHLAQVAACADAHIVVEKSTDGAVTRAQVHAVTGDARVEEIARLMSGKADSSTARAHAVELLEASAVAR